MTADSTSAPEVTPARAPEPARAPAPASWAWRRGGLLLAGAAQLITIAALLSADPLPLTWSALLLAIAPAPLAVLAAIGPAQVRLAAAGAAIVAMIVGLVGEVTHTGLFFVPAIVVLAVGCAEMWRERA